MSILRSRYKSLSLEAFFKLTSFFYSNVLIFAVATVVRLNNHRNEYCRVIKSECKRISRIFKLSEARSSNVNGIVNIKEVHF